MVLERTECFMQTYVVFLNKIRTVCQPFNVGLLKTVALTFTEIDFSQCKIELWTSGFKGLKGFGRAYLYY